ncbi:MAG: hypothetical protein ABI977_21755 [Acidobacteriota bacterium]
MSRLGNDTHQKEVYAAGAEGDTKEIGDANRKSQRSYTMNFQTNSAQLASIHQQKTIERNDQ